MNLIKKITLTAGIALLAAAHSAFAHHSYAPEFGNNPISYIEGTILTKNWESPHVSYDLEWTGGMDMGYEVLNLQSQAPSIMQRSYDVGEDFLNIGDKVAIKGRLSTYGDNGYQLISISINGGEEFALQRQGIPTIGAFKEQAGNRDLSLYGPDGLPLNPETDEE